MTDDDDELRRMQQAARDFLTATEHITPPPEEFGCPPDWEYRDLPWGTEEAYRQMFEILGEGNYKIIVESERIAEDGVKVRHAQIFMAPEGQQRAQQEYDLKHATNDSGVTH